MASSTSGTSLRADMDMDTQVTEELPDYGTDSGSETSFVLISEMAGSEMDEALSCASAQAKRETSRSPCRPPCHTSTPLLRWSFRCPH